MVNSHYVAQFILRNFYKDNKVTYCDLINKKTELRNTRSVFSEVGYYPECIEKDLCVKAEHRFANLFHNKLEKSGVSIRLNSEELFVIKKYLMVSAVRYKYSFTGEKEWLLGLMGAPNETDYNNCLNNILACEKHEDMIKYMTVFEDYLRNMLKNNNSDEKTNEIDSTLWAEMRDIMYSYLIFVRPRGDELFLIPDLGRGVFQGPLAIRKATGLIQNFLKGFNPIVLRLASMIGPRDYSVFPLSKDLAIISMSSFYKLLTESEFKLDARLPDDCPTVYEALGFGDKTVIKPPSVKLNNGNKEYRYEVKFLNSSDVGHLNALMLAEADKYVVCAGLSSIQKSLNMIKKYSDTDFAFMKL